MTKIYDQNGSELLIIEKGERPTFSKVYKMIKAGYLINEISHCFQVNLEKIEKILDKNKVVAC